jgi:hypothetical protein
MSVRVGDKWFLREKRQEHCLAIQGSSGFKAALFTCPKPCYLSVEVSLISKHFLN